MALVDWRFDLVVSETMERLGTIGQSRQRSVTILHNRAGGVSFTVPNEDPLFMEADAIKHGIVAFRNNVPKWSGMIWNINDQLPGNRSAVSAVGWFETLNHRIVRNQDLPYPRYASPPLIVTGGDIVFMDEHGSSGDTDYHPGGLLTIANDQRDTWISEGSNTDQMQRIVSYARGQNIGQAITDLSDTEAGFDFTINPLTRQMDIKNWNEYNDLSGEVAFGYKWGPENMATMNRQRDASTFAPRVTAMGKYGGGLAEDLEAIDEYQLFEEEIQLSDVVDPNVLLGYAGGEVVLRGAGPRTIYTLQPFPWAEGRTPQPFVDYNVGDAVEFSARKGRVHVDKQKVRVFGVTVSITDEGNEKLGELQLTPDAS